MAGLVGLQTAHRYGNATMLESDFVLGIGNRWANRHTGGVDTYRRGRTFVHVDIEPTQIGRVFAPDYGIVSDAKAALIRQSQRGFDMDYCVQLSFDNVNAPELNGYGVDHVAVARGLGCKALRVFTPDEIFPALEEARKLAAEHRVPVVVEIILERVTNIAMGTELDNVVEFEDLAERAEDAPTAIALLD